ncbi:type I restriction endonuclease subunit R [Maricaulis maris]|uniref:type I restriction endonuclease subunit R n=1 Tax=Maricaulis maris TaxID=74318 RepID=UPI0026F20B64|nr:HsdR family type I site-specific deoxyribonuclease [Maricaulis maris]
MTHTPRTSETYTSHVPAIKVMMALGWEYLSPPKCLDLRGGQDKVVLLDVLVEQLRQRRFSVRGQSHPLSPNSIDFIVRQLTAPAMNEGLAQANEKLYVALTQGITVTEFVEGKKHAVTVSVIDWEDVSANAFHVTEEFDVLKSGGVGTRRPDVIGFINGLPLVILEAKRPQSGGDKAMVEEGISQSIRNQKPDEVPLLFAYSQLLLSVSNVDGRYGTTRTPAKFWSAWREEEFDDAHFAAIKNAALPEQDIERLLALRKQHERRYFNALWAEDELPTDQDKLIISLLDRERLLEFIRLFILFDRKVGKIAARYQQFFGIRELLERIDERKPDGGREGGVVWHTTGSGKSFTMVLLCKALLYHQAVSNCRIVVVTDRVDLERQLSKTFTSGGAFGTSTASLKDAERSKVTSGKDLAKRIGSGDERIIFTLLQKFNSATKLPECHNDSENLIVLIDEGHRSQGGEAHERMRKALPRASYIAFTGTPLLKKDKTRSKFGKIIHAYTMQRAVEDGTVTPLLYEERKPQLGVNEQAIDQWFDRITAGLADAQRDDLKKKYAKKGVVYQAEDRIRMIAWDIADHFNANFKELGLGLKGQIAVDSKLSAVRMKEALDATGLVTSDIIISAPDDREGHSDVDESKLPEVLEWWKRNVPGKAEDHEKEVLEHFGTDGRPDLLIVVDKLLTGFDEPRNAVLYIDKPLKEHNLIQAIARVNRLHEQKKYGLLIDYRGILAELDTALTEYQDLASQTQNGYDLDDIEGLYEQIGTEYKRLPVLHDALWAIFAGVKNKRDLEQYRQVLVPRWGEDEDGQYDANQKVRDDFYAALTEFGQCLKVALASRNFHEDPSFGEAQIQQYKADLKFFTELRKQARIDAQETVDFSAYEAQIGKLVDRHIVGQGVAESEGIYEVGKIASEDPAEWTEEKVRAETDVIKSQIKKTIDQDLIDDPWAQAHFSEMLKNVIAEAEAMFGHPLKQYALFEDFKRDVDERRVDDLPRALDGNRHGQAYYGLFRLDLGEEAFAALGETDRDAYVQAALSIDQVVKNAIAENSLNPQNIEAAIRQGLLLDLFALVGLERAKSIIDGVVGIVRTGLGPGGAS